MNRRPSSFPFDEIVGKNGFYDFRFNMCDALHATLYHLCLKLSNISKMSFSLPPRYSDQQQTPNSHDASSPEDSISSVPLSKARRLDRPSSKLLRIIITSYMFISSIVLFSFSFLIQVSHSPNIFTAQSYTLQL